MGDYDRQEIRAPASLPWTAGGGDGLGNGRADPRRGAGDAQSAEEIGQRAGHAQAPHDLPAGCAIHAEQVEQSRIDTAQAQRRVRENWKHRYHDRADHPSLRWNAEHSTTPEPAEEWHRYTFPMFCDRMTRRIGESGCRTANHIQWPAEGRYAAFVGDTLDERRQIIYTDTRPVIALHARRA